MSSLELVEKYTVTENNTQHGQASMSRMMGKSAQ